MPSPEKAPLDIAVTAEGVTVPVMVAPRSSRSAIIGVHDGALKITLAAPPVEGAANRALITLLARSLKISKSRVAIITGDRSKRKKVTLLGVTEEAVRRLAGKA